MITEKGEIHNARNIAWIPMPKGEVRSNHYHREGGHLLVVLDGRILYKERDVGGGNPATFPVEQGECVYTGPMKEHRVEALENSLLISLGEKYASGTPDGDYEQDTVTVEW